MSSTEDTHQIPPATQLSAELPARMRTFDEELTEDRQARKKIKTSGEMNTETSNQQDTTDDQQIESYYEAEDDEVREQYRDAAVGAQIIGKSAYCIFVDLEGNNLLSGQEDEEYGTTTKILMRMEHHMSHIRFMARYKAKMEFKKFERAEKDDDKHSAEFNPISYNEPIGAYASIDTMISVIINHQAYLGCVVIDCSDIERLNEEDRKLFDVLPPKMHEIIAARKEKNGHPFFIQFGFNTQFAGLERVFLKTPKFAQKLAQQLQTGTCCAIVDGDVRLHNRINVILKEFEKGNPLQKYQSKQLSRLVFKKDTLELPDVRRNKTDDLDYQPKRVFHDLDEYLSVQAISVLSDMRSDTNNAASFNGIHHLRCGRLPGSRDQVMVGWLPVPEDCQLRLSPGSHCKVIFLQPGEVMNDAPNPNELEERGFHAIVRSDVITCGPRDFVSMQLSRPWSPETGFLNHDVHFVDVKDVSLHLVPSAVLNDDGNQVFIQWDVQDKVERNVIWSIDTFIHPPGGAQPTNWTKQCATLVVGSQIHTLQPVDMLEELRQSSLGQDFIATMQLNDDQKAAVMSMQKAPGGFPIVQGPAGTGKSQVWFELCRQILKSNAHFQTMIVSPANNAVNTIIEKLNKMMRGTGLGRGKYILRVHADATEKNLGRQEAKKTKMKTGRPSNFPDEITESLEAATQTFLAQYHKANQTKFEGIFDNRVRFPHESVMHTALEIAGVTQGPLTHPNFSKYAIFRKQYQYYAADQQVDIEQWKAAVDELWNDTMTGASIIVATTTQAGMRRVAQPLVKTLKLLIVDEAAHQSERDLIPLFATPFETLKGMLQLGDWLQLRPTSLASVDENIFAAQSRASLMGRLIALGLEHTRLRIQYRFVEGIAAIVNDTAYDGILVDTHRAIKENNNIAMDFEKEFKVDIGKRDCKVLFNFKDGKASRIQKTNSNSRYCDLYVIKVSELLTRLVKLNNGASILVLSAYKAQVDRYQEMVNNMEAAGVAGIDRVRVAVSESVQGDQFDYVIKDLLIDRAAPTLGFQNDMNRLTMEMTRGRCGFILLTEMDSALYKCKEVRFGYMARVINHFKQSRNNVKAVHEMPQCAYYQPRAAPKTRRPTGFRRIETRDDEALVDPDPEPEDIDYVHPSAAAARASLAALNDDNAMPPPVPEVTWQAGSTSQAPSGGW